ncbi:MAG: hypothetical protein LBE12_10900 [Planctomycetaceae bacterium]|jgi:hypothetical protein|nr:hypothetical protein [Planctomycetaceae bacterium]
MLEIFSTIICELIQKKDQGYFFVHNKELIYVPNNELSWKYDFCDTNTILVFLSIGHSMAVFITEYNYIEGFYLGSLKRAELTNPYKELFKLPPSTVIRGIVSNVQDSKTQQPIITFPNFTYGNFESICRKIPLVVGKSVDTIISFFTLCMTHEHLGLELPTKHTRKNFDQKYCVESIDDIKRISKIDPTRLDYGSIISAHLIKIESYGLWLSDGYNMIYVDLMGIFWDMRFSLADIKIEDKQVYILGYDYVKDYYLGSIKRAGFNPYKELSQFEPSTIFQGKIIDTTSTGDTIICLHNGAIGILENDTITRKNNDTIDVIIKKLSLDKDYGNLILETPKHHSCKKVYS